ncbi:MAG: hypothetical protein ACI9R7_001618, partial [Lysobacterales bacterium]
QLIPHPTSEEAENTNNPVAEAVDVVSELQPESPANSIDPDWLAIQSQAAWNGLALLWEEPEGGIEIRLACDGQVARHWACLKADGSLARIKQLGLPVILQLQGATPALLLLQGINGDRLLVGAPGTALTLSRSAIEDRWFGAYIVAWPQASSWPQEIERGDTGPAVETVLQLASMAKTPYAGGQEFEVEFERWLVDFQLSYGLEADGIVGPRTLLYLIRPSISKTGLLSSWKGEG